MADKRRLKVSETQENQAVEQKAKKAPVERTEVTMEDGRVVSFPGKRQVQKTVELREGGFKVTFDLRNGKTFGIDSDDLGDEMILRLAAHGSAQKVGDEGAGADDIDDIALGFEEMVKRLKAGEWGAERQAGDGFSGASIVIKAIVMAKKEAGQEITVEQVKEFLQKKLDASKAKAAETGAKALTRNDLYASFRNPNSRTGQIIEQLEREKKAKAAPLDASALMDEIGA